MRKALLAILVPALVGVGCGGDDQPQTAKRPAKTEPKPLTLETFPVTRKATTNSTITIRGRVTPGASVRVGKSAGRVRGGALPRSRAAEGGGQPHQDRGSQGGLHNGTRAAQDQAAGATAGGDSGAGSPRAGGTGVAARRRSRGRCSPQSLSRNTNELHGLHDVH